MEEKNLDPAFFELEYNASGYGESITIETPLGTQLIPYRKGMTKRFYAACAAMQGLLYNTSFIESNYKESIIKEAYEMADELIKQENL